MNVLIENRNIASIKLQNNEYAWKIEDVLLVLKYLATESCVILGGDILDNCINYTYDNWYYNINHSKDLKLNSIESISVAEKYISNYLENNGKNYYVVLVIM